MNFTSILLTKAVDELAKLPGIGRKTAVRLALHLLNQPIDEVEHFGESILRMRREIKHCKECYNISDSDICEVCSNPKRNKSLICVVQDIRDIMAIENTGQYSGVYHVLGGVISPMDGISHTDLEMASLFERVGSQKPSEVIMALPATIEGDTTNYFIFKNLKEYNVLITTLSRGVAIGDDLEFTDEITLGRSILGRQPYSSE